MPTFRDLLNTQVGGFIGVKRYYSNTPGEVLIHLDVNDHCFCTAQNNPHNLTHWRIELHHQDESQETHDYYDMSVEQMERLVLKNAVMNALIERGIDPDEVDIMELSDEMAGQVLAARPPDSMAGSPKDHGISPSFEVDWLPPTKPVA